MSGHDGGGSPLHEANDYDNGPMHESDEGEIGEIDRINNDIPSPRDVNDDSNAVDGDVINSNGSRQISGDDRVQRNTDPNDPLAGSRRIFVGNLPWSTTSEDCIDFFSKYGHVEKAQIIYKKDEPGAGRSRGIAFVTFTTEEATLSAANDPEEQVIGDRRLNIEVAAMQGSGWAGSRSRPLRGERGRPPPRGGRDGYDRDRSTDRFSRSGPYDRPDREERRRDRPPPPSRDPYEGYRRPRDEPAPHPRRDAYVERGPPRSSDFYDDARGGGGRGGDAYAPPPDRDRDHRRGARDMTPPGAYDIDPRDRGLGGRGMSPMSRDPRDMPSGRSGYVDERPPFSGRGGYEPRDVGYSRGGGPRDGPYDPVGPGEYGRNAGGGRDDPYRSSDPLYEDAYVPVPPRGGPMRYEQEPVSGGAGYRRGGSHPSDRRGPPPDRGVYEREYAGKSLGGDRYASDRNGPPPSGYDDYAMSAPVRQGGGSVIYDDYAPAPRGGGGGGKGDRYAADVRGGGGGDGGRYSTRGPPPGQAGGGNADSLYARGHGVYDRHGNGGGGERTKDSYPPRRSGGR